MRMSLARYRFSCLLLLLILLAGCYPRNVRLEPQLSYVPRQEQLSRLSSPFPPLLPYEKREAWASEYLIAVAFAREVDLYRAITSYKRALVLLPSSAEERRREISYSIALCYYLGGKYHEAVQVIESSSVARATSAFPAYRDLLIVLYESYMQTEQEIKALLVWEKLEALDHETGTKLALSTAIRRADFPALTRLERQQQAPGIKDLMANYCAKRKSLGKAQFLNAALPGLGYFYIGQKQSAVTAAIVNGLFIFGSYQFFARGYWAAGAFTTALEVGWYVGGIYGAGEAAHDYNRRLYERSAGPYMCAERLFPIMMLKFSF